MMVKIKSSLLATTLVAALASSPAFAQQFPLAAPTTSDGALHGAGATSIQNIIVRDFNCIATDQKLGKSASATSLSTVSPGLYSGTPSLDCSVEANNIQPNLVGEYVATGSGFGRQIWKDFSDDFDGSSASTATAGVFNPFGTVTRWNHVQYAFSDAGLAQAELTTYNTSAAPSTGAAITFPLFVLPIAIAYDSTYGTNAKGHAMVFNTQGKGLGGTVALQLKKADYCAIFNGDITNWNAAQLTASNKRIALFDPINDTAARWAADGAPIRLVGRLDKSGTTDVFTRHLAAVCNASYGYTGTNKYLQHAESLPYNAAANGNANFTSVRSDTNYKPGVAGSKFAGTTNLISGDYFNGSAIVNIAAGTPTSLPTGNVGSGLYLIADGGGKVASALVLAPDYTLNGAKLNGKVGYISADFVQPSVDAPGGLNAAGLQVGNTGAYALPTVLAANKGVAAVLPPESDSVGAYKPGTDTRLVTPVSGTTKVAATRDNPLAWVEVLYADPTNTLADPQLAGSYPISGTTQFFGYTCYAGADTRQALNGALAILLGKVNKGYNGTAFQTISKLAFGGTAAAAPGINVQANIGVVPAAWSAAITNTFLSKADAAAAGGPNGLYIQDAILPVYRNATAKDPNRIKTPTNANASCSGLPGA